MTSAGLCGMSTITARLAHVVREMSLNGLIGQAIKYTLGRRWLAHVDCGIVKSGGPCGMGSPTEGAVRFSLNNSCPSQFCGLLDS